MARARRGRSSTSVKRPVEWLRVQTDVITIDSALGVSVAAAFDLTATALLTIVSPTIVRIRGQLTLAGDFMGVEFLTWAAGIVQMSRKAFTTGIAAVPFPNVDDADWQWFAAGAIGDGASAPVPAEDTTDVVIDTKSMRRYEQDDQTMVLVVANNSLVAAGEELFMQACLSILIKE